MHLELLLLFKPLAIFMKYKTFRYISYKILFQRFAVKGVSNFKF